MQKFAPVVLIDNEFLMKKKTIISDFFDFLGPSQFKSKVQNKRILGWLFLYQQRTID